MATLCNWQTGDDPPDDMEEEFDEMQEDDRQREEDEELYDRDYYRDAGPFPGSLL